MVKVLSIDVGIRNLSLAHFTAEYTDEINPLCDEYESIHCLKNVNYTIHDWCILDISPPEYSCCDKTKQGKPCKKIVRWIHEGKYYCDFHKQDGFTPIVSATKENRLYHINKKLINTFDNMPQLLNIDYLLIENQPVRLNPIIKSIQMFIYSYFMIRGCVDKNNIREIKLVHAKNKLKLCTSLPEPKVKSNYAKAKKKSIMMCDYLISDNQEYIDMFNSTKKKDDLSDALLQGLWFITTLKLI
jgi:hypothetical protein